MGLAGGLFLRQAKDHEPCAVPCDTWASGIRELPVEVIAMPSAQRDLSHSSHRTYTHMHPCRAATFTGVKRTSVRLHICMTSPDLSQHLFFPFQQGFGMVQLCWIFFAISNTVKKKTPARTAYRFRLDLLSSQGKRKDSFMCFCH